MGTTRSTVPHSLRLLRVRWALNPVLTVLAAFCKKMCVTVRSTVGTGRMSERAVSALVDLSFLKTFLYFFSPSFSFYFPIQFFTPARLCC